MPQITLPSIDFLVQMHHDEANAAIAGMSPSRSYGAETNLSSWARHLTAIDPAGKDGYAFTGSELRRGVEATVPLGALILVVDSSWAKAKWYAGSYISPLERRATLHVAEAEGLRELLSVGSRRWAENILGFLVTNQALRETAGVKVGVRAEAVR